MKEEKENPRQIVDRFLGKMAEPVSDKQSARAVSGVLERLRAEDVRVVSFPAFTTESRPVWPRVWRTAAACAIVILAGGLLQILFHQNADAETVARALGGEIHAVGKNAAFLRFSRIEGGRAVRAGSGGGTVELVDGSQIDMSPDAVLSVVRETDGLRVKLDSGIVLVTAARQPEGSLYVETKDCVVSVKGTVFAVSAEESGSRVSVLEGEVQLQSGEVSRTLLAGEQASTSPQLPPLPAESGDSRPSPERLALLQQPTVPAAQPLPANTGSTIRGIVKGSNGAGIADVSVTLCPNFTKGEAVAAPANPPARVPFDDVVHVDGPIVRNKAFFFGLWSGCTSTSVLTDSMGRFEFSKVLPGEYAVRAEREGFSGPPSESSENRVDGGGILRYFNAWNRSAGPGNPLSGDSMRVTVYAQQVSQEIFLNLIRAGVIAGRVRDTDGKPVVNAQVRVFSVPVQGATGDGLNVITTTTNDLGEYRAYWLLPSDYRVVAAANGRPLTETWFPRGATAAEATTVVLREGEDVPGIDIILRPVSADAPPPQPGGPGARR